MRRQKHKQKQKTMRTIGRWFIGETLGKGGYSWVKKGYDKKTGKCVALKFMAKADDSWAKEQAKQVVTEIESLKQIRHPNVMKLYAYNLNARYPTQKNEKVDSVLLVLEFAPGGEIFDILYYTSALEPILARTYFRQSIFGLEACHKAGVAHRDIKPQNLLLDARFNIKLTDFGLSKVFESDADAIMKTTYVGTRGYQAPELLLEQSYDLACDVFSMGVVLFILITGYPPFEQAHYSDRWFRPLAKGDTEKFWKFHSGCCIAKDAQCKDLLQRMLCYDPKQRITIAEIKKHKWFIGEYLEGKGLIKALRHRHREMESKRRKDARKIKDLQVSINPNRSVGEPVIEEWDEEMPEEMMSNVYCHYEIGNVKEFFGLLSGLIGNTYHGETKYLEKEGKMLCTISKMERGVIEVKKCDYKFEIGVFVSKIYNGEEVLKEFKERQMRKIEDEGKEKEKENSEQERDEKAHGGKNKPIVLVVTTKRLQGDDYKFRRMQTKLLQDGAVIFNGLPDGVVKKKDKFDEILENWDEDEDENKEEEYDDVEWDQ